MIGGVSLGAEKPLAYVGVIAGDLHGGAFEAKRWYDELDARLLNYISRFSLLDYVILNGDLFDTKISINSEHAKYILLFLTKLVNICIQKGTKLRILKGTESHDNKQLEILESLFLNSECDIRMIHTVESEWLFDDLHVLYIPEEYIDDKSIYYKEHFRNKYDMIFGHGLIQEALHMAATQESESTMPKAPVFKSEELIDICHGPIFFSHVHNKITIKKRIHYTNSFSRFAFGEENNKGYYVCFYFPVEHEYRLEYRVNDLARTYNTLEVDCTVTGAVSEQVDYMVKLVDDFSKSTDYLRLEVNIPEEYPNPLLLSNSLTEVFGSRRRFKLKINNNSKIKQKKQDKDTINKLKKKYDFIFDKKLPIEIKISKYIKVRYDRDISINKMLDYMYQDIFGESETHSGGSGEAI